MRRQPVVLIVLLALGGGLTALLSTSAVQASPAGRTEGDRGEQTVYTATLTAEQLGLLIGIGIDRSEISSTPASSGSRARVELVLSPSQAASLKAKGLPLTEKRVDGQTVSDRLAAKAAVRPTVFRSYSERGGLRDEYEGWAREYRDLTKLERIGTTVNGKPIIALKVTKDARTVPDGTRPSVLYVSNQHAREWITPEMNRRLVHHVLEGYATDQRLRQLVDSTELWFVPSANPDGYDYTFTRDHRLWRKNLRDNDGDGVITGQDGVDPNRNFPTKWNYDDEGSSGLTASETYRGPSPASEPETQAMIGLMDRVRFRFLVNYHSAAELILYGVGWQVSTPTPDDTLYEAMAGDDRNPAVPGSDPDLSAELYTTNGETDDHASTAFKTLAFTPEMSTCETASAVDPDDAFDPGDCESVFSFPDSEPLIEGEFEKNLPFALAVAESAADPDDPVSVVGRTAPDFVPDSFTTSYGDPQPVAVTARRALRNLRLHYSINGGPTKTARVKEWQGGQRYGETDDVYYAEYRGTVRGASPGDTVRVWFTGSRAARGSSTPTARTSAPFTYRLASDSNAEVLVVANEDYTGVNPTYSAAVTASKYATTYTDALAAGGASSVVWDVDRQGVPHDLGVLSHFKGVVWYLGRNRLTQDPEDRGTSFLGQTLPDSAVAERQQYLTMAVRDYLNAGGALVHTGETAAYYGLLGADLGGIYYGLNGAPDQECVVTSDPFGDCLLLADDFSQYWLGAYSRTPLAGPTSVLGSAPLNGLRATFGGPGLTTNPLNEAGSFGVTSDVLPPSTYPLFRSQAAAAYQGSRGGAFDPVEGEWYAGRLHADGVYARLARTVDLRGVAAGQAPSLDFQLSFDTEPGYDSVLVEAHTVGSGDWTTLPEAGGLSRTTVPDECEAGFLLAMHPWLEHYLTLAGDACTPSGSSGTWNQMTGTSGGWRQVSFDLSAYAGKQVEVAIAYVTDPVSGGTGVVVDDTRIKIDGVATEREGFESGLGAWAVSPAPPGSPTPAPPFVRARALLSAGVSTPHTLLLGFGLEQVDPASRPAVVRSMLRTLRTD